MQVPPLRKIDGTWARSDEEKAIAFATHLEQVFQSNPIHSSINLHQCNRDPAVNIDAPIRLVHPLVAAKEIDKLKSKKVPGFGGISARILKELPKKGIIMLTYIINAAFRLHYVPQDWKKAEVIIVLKRGKSSDLAMSYRPISLLPVLSKLFEKLLLRRLKPLLQEQNLLPDEQYGF